MSYHIRLRKQFNSLQEYWEFVYDNFLVWDNMQLINGNWTEEEYKKLKPFFDFHSKKISTYDPLQKDSFEIILSEEEKASSVLYSTILQDPKFMCRKLVSTLGAESILGIFRLEHPFYTQDQDLSEEQEDNYFVFDRNIPWKFISELSNENLSFPIVLNLWREKDRKDTIDFFDLYSGTCLENIFDISIY